MLNTDSKNTFGEMGETYQQKVVQALIENHSFAEQMIEVIDHEFFDQKYLQEIVKWFYAHKKKYGTYPSYEMLNIMTTKQGVVDKIIIAQICNYINASKSKPIGGDSGFIEESSLDFCKKNSLKEGLLEAIDMMEAGNYDVIQGIIKKSLNRCGERDFGHEYLECFLQRGAQSKRESFTTGWKLLNDAFNGGWEKKTLTTFIGSTGAGKSHFLVNCGAAAVQNGLNVVYVTLELADWKVGLRFDAYYADLKINDVTHCQDKVRASIDEKAKGKLYIKEWPTNVATVQSIRSYIQRLIAVKNFFPDMLIVDYADLLRGPNKIKDRYDVRDTYNELRDLSKEFNMIVITADQSNREGVNMELITVKQIGEAYAKAQICDVILTISRTMEDKQANCGRLFLAKSRLGADGLVFPFLLNTAMVKVTLLKQDEDPLAMFMENNQDITKMMATKYNRWNSKRKQSAGKSNVERLIMGEKNA